MKISATLQSKIVFCCLCVSLLITACDSKPENKTKVINADSLAKNKITVLNLNDTLSKYSGKDSLFTGEHETLFYSGEINECLFALVYLNDSTVLIRAKKVNSWVTTDSIYIPNFSLDCLFREMDLNGDKFDDLIITYSFTAAGGNQENIVLIFDETKQQLYHHASWDLPNINYDRETNLVHSSWWGGSRSSQYKYVYRICNDKVIFKAGTAYVPDENGDNPNGTIIYYHMQGKKEIIDKKQKGHWEKIWPIFEKALWNSTEEY